MQQSPITEHLYDALLTAYMRAQTAYPGEEKRIKRGLDLIHDGHVTLLPDKHIALITSSDGTRTYQVNGQCECVDFQRAPGGRCKHRWAKALLRKAHDMLLHTYYATVSTPDGAMHGIARVQPDGTLRFRTDCGNEIVYSIGAPALTLGASVGIADVKATETPLWQQHATSPYPERPTLAQAR